MNQTSTITSKMQLTLPIFIARRIGLEQGDKVAVSEADGRIVLTPIKQLLTELEGSLSVKPEWKGKDIDTIIREAKVDYFKNKKK